MISLRRWAILAVSIIAVVAPAASAPEYRGITILHTNDTHDHLFPFSYPDPPSSSPAYASRSETKDIGGIARRATIAREIRLEMHGNALLMDAGDISDGTPFSIEYLGEASFAAMSAAGYDIMTLGNHEFGQTLDQFRRNIGTATFPIVCANLLDRKTGKLLLPPYLICDIDGAKIAVMGLTVMSPEYKAAKEGLDFLDPYQVARELVPALKKQADIVIVLSHLGSSEDEMLAKEAPGIDVIVGGHSHARITKPKLIRQTDERHAFWIGGTVIVQAYEKGAELGRLDLRLRRDGGPFTLMGCKGQLIPITSAIPDDPTTAAVVNRYYRPMKAYYGEVLGEATATFYDDRSRESTILNLVCDAIREAAQSEVGIYGIGGVRADLQSGPVRGWDIATVLPFKNKLVVMEITGQRLKEGLLRFRPGVSGMRYRVVGERMVEASIGGKPVDDSAIYKVATIDWLVSLYFTDVADTKVMDTMCSDAVISYIKSRGKITPTADGRRVIE